MRPYPFKCGVAGVSPNAHNRKSDPFIITILFIGVYEKALNLHMLGSQKVTVCKSNKTLSNEFF